MTTGGTPGGAIPVPGTLNFVNDDGEAEGNDGEVEGTADGRLAAAAIKEPADTPPGSCGAFSL